MRTGITELTFIANGLTPFTIYTFQVAGVNCANTGVYSDIIFITTLGDSKNLYNDSVMKIRITHFPPFQLLVPCLTLQLVHGSPP